ncbi:ATP-dependent helicase [Clostridium sp. P21]|uniref:DNA 3'-5' helicase n=2 Tax=Clostridium muellerianum TaxID=2716538 RepID=A0A7Y0EHD9_9CLOT|nr:ATP-dependent helicase [Clostridium muellerianum]NMM63147.1 ATP-dependent helicase [Clostridium muellerianum]
MNDLDIYQKKSVYTKDENVLIVAPPGSGKTAVIVNRTAYLINDLGVNPNNMVVITFTKAAAVNMKKRYINMTGSKHTPFFGTFHGLFYKILMRHVRKVNIIDSSKTYRIINEVLISFLDSVGDEKIREVINNISLFKNSKEELEYFKPSIDKDIFVQCFRVYEEYKEENQLMDFDDLQLNAKKLFLENPNLLASYRRLFKYLLVDEFQDCDSIQIELLQMLGQNNSIFAVGDEDQCIYGFRGSRPDCMVNFNEYFKDGKKIFLCTNYRSNENIVDISKKIVAGNKNRNNKVIESNKKTRGIINFFKLSDEKEQALNICKTIESLCEDQSYNLEDFAVLYRTNLENRSVVDVMLKREIPFKILDKQYNFFEHFICKDLIAYLKLSLDISDKESFARIINKPFRYISKVHIEKVKKDIKKESCFKLLVEEEDIAIFQIKNLERLEKDILKLNKMGLRDALNVITKDLGYYDYINEYSQRLKMDSSELIDVIEEFKISASDYNGIIPFLAHIEDVEERLKKKSKEESGVILSTIHGVKGMEFKNVFIINCNEGVIPHINSIPKNVEEERRLFYVGVTRAIDNLTLYSTNTFKGKAAHMSRFIEESGVYKSIREESTEKLKGKFNIGDEITHKTFGKGKIISYEGSYVNIKFNNFVERKFDAYVLSNSDLLIR